MTRDDVDNWHFTMLSFMRQDTRWTPFLPGGEHAIWFPRDEDAKNCLRVPDDAAADIDQAATDALQAGFQDFLTCIATNCPTGFANTVRRESTSIKWITDKIYATYGLQTKGQHFLDGQDIKFDLGPAFTYEQGWMVIKDFYLACLLDRDSRFKGRVRAQPEVLSPLAETFLIEKWLMKIDPRLLDHIRKTRGYFFTTDKPTLACNREILSEQLDVLLAELNNSDTTVNKVVVGQVFF